MFEISLCLDKKEALKNGLLDLEDHYSIYCIPFTGFGSSPRCMIIIKHLWIIPRIWQLFCTSFWDDPRWSIHRGCFGAMVPGLVKIQKVTYCRSHGPVEMSWIYPALLKWWIFPVRYVNLYQRVNLHFPMGFPMVFPFSHGISASKPDAHPSMGS